MHIRYLSETYEYIYGTHLSRSQVVGAKDFWYDLTDDENEIVATIEPENFERLEILSGDEWRKFILDETDGGIKIKTL